MASELRPGDRIAGCVIEAELGRGGMGAVYRARQESLRRLVAVKVISSALSDDAGFARRFEREAHLAAAIEHPSVVPIYAAGEEAGRLYLVMRYIAGTDLAGIVLERGALAPRRAAAIGRALGSALDAAHARGLVHRDVKPANVLLAGREGDEHALLTDFGLSKESTSQSGLTATGHWLGTLDYVAPEQLEGRELDARADVYSLGCLLFECLSGRVPFEGTPASATPSERRVETVTGTATTSKPPATDPEVGASDDWPLDRSAYTVVLRSTTTRAQADATSAAGAEAGLPAGGVLDSGDFQSLRPGYWVAFSGAVASEAEATTIAEQALDAGFEDAYVRFVSAG